MPIYEYHCPRCGRDFEKLVFSRTAPVECPSCHNPEVEKKFSTFAHKSSSGFTSSVGSSCGGCTSTACSSCKK